MLSAVQSVNMPLTAHRRTGLSPFFLVTNLLIWISAVIVMGIVSYWISQGAGGDHIIYEEVIVRACCLPSLAHVIGVPMVPREY